MQLYGNLNMIYTICKRKGSGEFFPTFYIQDEQNNRPYRHYFYTQYAANVYIERYLTK